MVEYRLKSMSISAKETVQKLFATPLLDEASAIYEEIGERNVESVQAYSLGFCNHYDLPNSRLFSIVKM